MSTDVDCANLALIELGQAAELLTSFDDATKHARILKVILPIVRKEVLGCRPWSFARKRALLNADATGVPFGTGARFQQPQDFIRFVLDKDNPDQSYRLENGFIVSEDGAPLELLYIFDQADIGKWSGPATVLLSMGFAAYSAYAITGDKGVRDDMEALYGRRLTRAGFIDSWNEEADALDADVWIRAHQR